MSESSMSKISLNKGPLPKVYYAVLIINGLHKDVAKSKDFETKEDFIKRLEEEKIEYTCIQSVNKSR